MSDELGLSVNGKIHTGWHRVTVTRSMEQLSHSFAIGYTARSTVDEKPIDIVEGDACELKIGTEVIIKGYVDDLDDGYSATTTSSQVTGRNLGDIVDCSVEHKPGHWRKATLLTIAQALCDPFNVAVKSDIADLKEFRGFSVQEGETVFEALNRAAKMRGLIMLSSGKQEITFARVGQTKTQTVLKWGVNIIEGSRRRSMKERFSSYTIKTQAVADDQWFGAGPAQLKQSTEDTTVTRHRPLTMMAENEDSGRELKDRVEWERNSRYGKAQRITYKVQGWRDEAGKIWAPNLLVRVDDQRWQVKDELVVASATLEKGDGGTTTTLELVRPEAFTLQPQPPPKPRGKTIVDFRPGSGG